MKIDSVKATVITTTLLASSLATAGLNNTTPAPVEAPVMGPWALGMMAALIAAVAYRIKKK